MANVRGVVRQRPETTILDLPNELITYICRSDALKLNDVFNLAASHPKFNDCLFREPNSYFWKSKYLQKYGHLDEDEGKIIINEQNTWKDEIMARLSLDKAVPFELTQMQDKFSKFKTVPYHMFPFSEQLNSNYQRHRYYTVSASAAYYKYLLDENRKCCSDNFDLVYVAHSFFIYSCQVYYGYKINDFLSLPPNEQTVERGFYLLDRWWYPTTTSIVEMSYNDISKHFNNIAMTVCDLILSINPLHPLVKHVKWLDQIEQRGKTNLDHDVFDETSTIFILDCLKQIMLSNSNEPVCPCYVDMNCFMLQHVITRNKGSVFLLCVIYESVARRLGIKVRLIATSAHNFISWTSSWPGNKLKDPTCYIIDIAVGGIMRKATVCPVSRKLPEQYKGNSIPDLFWTFGKIIEQLHIKNIVTYKYVLDFLKLLRPDDAEVEFKCQKFHQYYEYCQCPLIRNSLNPYAPNHVDEKNYLQTHKYYRDN